MLIVSIFSFSCVHMEGYNLLVTSAIEMAVVYRSESDNFIKISVEESLGFVCFHSDFIPVDEKMALGRVQNSVLFVCLCFIRDVQERGLSRSVCLSESDQWDAVLCALVIDLDFDGQKEVLLGTYGQVRAPLY